MELPDKTLVEPFRASVHTRRFTPSEEEPFFGGLLGVTSPFRVFGIAENVLRDDAVYLFLRHVLALNQRLAPSNAHDQTHCNPNRDERGAAVTHQWQGRAHNRQQAAIHPDIDKYITEKGEY